MTEGTGPPRAPEIAVVGICASGKTTLMHGLQALGYKAHAVPQEHSFVRRLWQKLHPGTNILILLDAQYETTTRRRPSIGYGPERLAEQRERLKIARAECDLYLPTDEASVDEVRLAVVEWIEKWKGMS